MTTTLTKHIKGIGATLGFQAVQITDTDLSAYHEDFTTWLAKHYHGDMDFMAHHGDKRLHPEKLIPGTKRIIMVRMDYLTADKAMVETLQNPNQAYIARYALGRDYHKLMRKRLQTFAKRIEEKAGEFGYRCFVDSAPVLEKPLAEKAGLGWIGKNTLLLHHRTGSWFFLGALFTDLDLPIDPPQYRSHCGSCTACIDVCPTKAIVAPYQLDARKCISYLTIEYRGIIPEHYRPLIGNRIFGCDDCQIVCPWNKFAKESQEIDFHARRGLASSDLITLFQLSETEFLRLTEGSAMRRITYDMWLRNIAIALGNAPASEQHRAALKTRLDDCSDMVKVHIQWALTR